MGSQWGVSLGKQGKRNRLSTRPQFNYVFDSNGCPHECTTIKFLRAQYTMVSHVGGSLGQLQILNLDQTVATHSLISIFKIFQAISPTDHVKAHLQCVHF